MTERTTNDEEPLEVQAQVQEFEKVRPWDAPLWKLLGELVAFLPTHRNSRDGRKFKKQMQIILIVVGIGMMALGGTADSWGGFWIVLGMLIACLGFVAPVEEMKKRTWRSRIAKRRAPRQKPAWTPGRVCFDGRRVELHRGEQKVRQVRVDRNKHELRASSMEGAPAMGVLGPGGKPQESIWVVATDEVRQEIQREGKVKSDETDRLARIDPQDWEQLWDALNQTG